MLIFMNLIKIIKKGIGTILLASALSSFACNTYENKVTPAPKSQNEIYASQRISYFKGIDKEFEPELEKEIEQDYNVDILGEPEFLTDKNLQKLKDDLYIFKEGKIQEGLNIVLGEDGFRDLQTSGSNYKRTDFGPAIFIAKPHKSTPRHELTHHIQVFLSANQRKDFDERWNSIQTKIFRNGEYVWVSNEEAIRTLNMTSLGSWKLTDFEGEEKIVNDFGLFGFARPYGISGENNPTKRMNLEDVATISELSYDDKSESDRFFSKGLAYWEPEFEISPYLEKIALLQQYIIKDSVAERMKKRLKDRYEAYSEFRTPEILFSNLEQNILSATESLIIYCCKRAIFSR